MDLAQWTWSGVDSTATVTALMDHTLAAIKQHDLGSPGELVS